MRLIHTSDWHFGKSFNETDLIPYQETFCDWLIDVVKQERIDCVLIAGDVYDRAQPPASAVGLLDDVLHRIHSAGASIVMISGNHDSAERLHFGTRFMAGSGVYVRTERQEISEIADPVLIRGADGTEIEVLPLPYLDPERVKMAAGTTRNHESVLQAVIDHQRDKLRDPKRSIAMSHAFLRGGTESDSERKLTVGGQGQVSPDLFKDFGYVALGHLHRPHSIKDERIQYSGTPMPYSFSEQHEKSIRVIDVESGGFSSHTLSIPTYRPVVTISGELESLLGSSEFAAHETSFVRARLTDTSLQFGAMDRIRRRFPFALELEMIGLSSQNSMGGEPLLNLVRRSVEDVVEEYVTETWPEGLDNFEKEIVHGALVTALREDD